jgi:hypothetical protein
MSYPCISNTNNIYNNKCYAPERKTFFFNSEFNKTLPSSGSLNIIFNEPVVNQMNLYVNQEIISAPSTTAYYNVELVANIECAVSNNANFSLDISGLSSDFFEIIDTRFSDKLGTYYLTFGSHIFSPLQFRNEREGFNFVLDNHTNQPVDIIGYKFLFRAWKD